jgi:hypothetical protein
LLQGQNLTKNNANINLELLEIEELLVQLGLLTLEEIKNPELLS